MTSNTHWNRTLWTIEAFYTNTLRQAAMLRLSSQLSVFYQIQQNITFTVSGEISDAWK